MAYVSLGINRGAFEMQPDEIAIGSDDGGAGNNLTVSIDLTKGITRLDAVKMLESIIRRLEDNRFNDLVNV